MKLGRRGFLQMIGGALAAALTPAPLRALAAPPTMTTYLVGADAVVSSPFSGLWEQRSAVRDVSYRVTFVSGLRPTSTQRIHVPAKELL